MFAPCVFAGAAEVGVGLRRGAQENDRARLHPVAGAVLLEPTTGKRTAVVALLTPLPLIPLFWA